MDLGICTIVYNGYGKYLSQWLESVRKVNPSQITIVLGENHGVDESILKDEKVIRADSSNLGELKNLAVGHTLTEWVMNLGVDDEVLPGAIESFKKWKDKADIIATSCIFKEEGKPDKIAKASLDKRHIIDFDFQVKAPKFFFHGGSPFRRELWEKYKYQDNDCYNALFWIDCALGGAKIMNIEKPALTYLRHKGSHSDIPVEERQKRARVIRAYKKEERENWLKTYPTFGVFMIVKNEEEMIEEALKSTQGVDELVICDTGSTDKTIEICKKYTDKVYTDYQWNDNFAEAKNHAASKCKSDWIMGLDADCRLEEGGVAKIKDIIQRTPWDAIKVRLHPKGFKEEVWHERTKIYKNDKDYFYKGRAHEDLNIIGEWDNRATVTINYDYSPNHHKDPERYIRILTKAIAEEPNNTRWRFYLAKEYYHHRKYDMAIEMFKDYISRKSHYIAETAEAYYYMAECYWYTQQGETAREACLKSIGLNPEHRKALHLMSIMHYEPNKSRWAKLAKNATNEGVIFKQ